MTTRYSVDVDGGDQVVRSIRDAVESTHGPEVLCDYGGFGGLFELDGKVLCASTDSVGSKIALAQRFNRMDGIGEDLVNHCVNDILVQSPTMQPLFFLDYLASDKLRHDESVTLVESVCRACKKHGMALLGGETAEIKSVYQAGRTDIAGTIVGVTRREHLLRPKESICKDDVVLAFPSNGLMTNGYTYVMDLLATCEPCEETMQKELMAIHPSYQQQVSQLDHKSIKGMVHVTGGGLVGNAHRIMPDGLLVNWDTHAIQSMYNQLAVYRWLFEPDHCSMRIEEKIKTFNCGAGFLIVADPTSEIAVAPQRFGLTQIGHVSTSATSWPGWSSACT